MPSLARSRRSAGTVMVLSLCLAGPSWANEPPSETVSGVPLSENSHLDYGGYLKLDTMISRYSDGRLPARSVGRDFYVPATIPVGGESAGADLDMHIKETRFWLRTDTLLPDGRTLEGYLEFDFTSGAPGGNERISNAYAPSIRHAHVRYGNWLMGQSWSSFFKVEALAENLDFIGPTEGTVFVRQPQLRYTSGPWQFSLENPETTVTPFGGGDRIVTDAGAMPDMVIRYNASPDWGSLSVAALFRQLALDNDGERKTTEGLGLSLGAKMNLGEENDLRFMLTHGQGIGRYLGLNFSNDAVLDADGDLQTIDSTGGFVSYRHFWSSRWRSNLTLSGQLVDNDSDLTEMATSRDAVSAHVNLIRQLNPRLMVGAEYIRARRTLESGERGYLDRFQFSVRHDF